MRLMFRTPLDTISHKTGTSSTAKRRDYGRDRLGQIELVRIRMCLKNVFENAADADFECYCDCGRSAHCVFPRRASQRLKDPVDEATLRAFSSVQPSTFAAERTREKECGGTRARE